MQNEVVSINELRLYTIGHSNLPEQEFIRLLQKYEVRTLVDVRSAPYSKYNPQFNRETLKKTLQQAGIDYRFAGDYLGGRPKDPTCYKDGVLPDGHADYLHLVDYPAVMTRDFFIKGIDYLLVLAERAATAVMCSEGDPDMCHRHHLIGRYLVEQRGVRVLHILGDGKTILQPRPQSIANTEPVTQLLLFN